MVLARWSPFGQVLSLPSVFDSWTGFTAPAFRAPIDVQQTGDGYRVQAALPGFKPDEVQVTLDRGTLTISAKRSGERKTEQGRYLRREVYSGSFQRRLALPAEVKAEDVQASFENGILTVDVRHAAVEPAVRIPVTGRTETEAAAPAEPAAATA